MSTSNQEPDKTVIITGGNTGLGYECARAIAASDPSYHIVIASRSPQKAVEAVRQIQTETGHQHTEAIELDLASFASVRQFVTEVTAKKLPPLRAIVCNAGIQVVSGTTYTQDGFETTFGVNHLGHFLLVTLLLGSLQAPARILFVSSGTHDPKQHTGMPTPQYRTARLLAHPEADPTANSGAVGRLRYTTSKLCNVLCTYEMARQLKANGYANITVNAFDPGGMPNTGLTRDYGRAAQFIWNRVLPALSPILKLFNFNVKTARTSGQDLARLVYAPQFANLTSQYFEGNKAIRSSDESYDLAKAQDLWQTSLELTQLQPVVARQ